MRRRPVAGQVAAVAAVLAIGALLWWAWRPASEADAAVGVPATASLPQPVQASAAGRLLAGATPAPAVAAAAMPRATVPADATQAESEGLPSAEAGAPVWELCGVGRLPVPRGPVRFADLNGPLATLPPHLGRDALAQAYAALVEALDAGPPRWRAAAVMLRGSDATGRPQAVVLPGLAYASDDPVVAMWALQRCDLGASCLEMAARWAQLEPQNLAAWADLLARQPQRRRELIARMAAASRFDHHEQALSRAVLEAMPAGVAPYLQRALWTDVIGIEAAMPMPGFKAVFDHCRAPLAAGSEAMRECAAIARTVAERGDAVLGIALGLGIARHIGLEAENLAQWRAEVSQGLTERQGPPDGPQPWSCASVAETRAWVEQRARLGEVGALRARAALRAASAASR